MRHNSDFNRKGDPSMPRPFSVPMRMLAAGLAFFAMTDAASAQFYGGSSTATPAASQTYARGLSGSGQQGANVSSFSYNPYAPYGSAPAVATPWSTQYGSWIQPAASYWAQDDIARQQAYTQNRFQSQDYQLRQMQVKRATFDEMMYEKMNTPPPETFREDARLSRLMRARDTPPLDEIASGETLNELLTDIQRIQAREGVVGNSIPLDPEVVKHLNVTTTGNARGSNEMFKPGNFPDWPIAFAGPSFENDKKKVTEDLAGMAKAQEAGKVDNEKAADARRIVEGMQSKLFQIRAQVSFSDYVNSLEYLSKLTDTINTLAKPGAKNFLDGTYAAKGNTVSELVDYMISKGLKFARATPGFEPYYSSLYQQLVTYDIGLSRVVGQQQQSTIRTQGPKN